MDHRTNRSIWCGGWKSRALRVHVGWSSWSAILDGRALEERGGGGGALRKRGGGGAILDGWALEEAGGGGALR